MGQIFCQIVKNFSEYYETRKFINLFIRARKLLLFWTRSIQFTPRHYSFKIT